MIEREKGRKLPGPHLLGYRLVASVLLMHHLAFLMARVAPGSWAHLPHTKPGTGKMVHKSFLNAWVSVSFQSSPGGGVSHGSPTGRKTYRWTHHAHPSESRGLGDKWSIQHAQVTLLLWNWLRCPTVLSKQANKYPLKTVSLTVIGSQEELPNWGSNKYIVLKQRVELVNRGGEGKEKETTCNTSLAI